MAADFDTGKTNTRIAYRPTEVADALGIGRTVVYRLIKEGRIRTLRVGTRIVVPREAILDFLRKGLNE